jgi:uncharacterized protein
LLSGLSELAYCFHVVEGKAGEQSRTVKARNRRLFLAGAVAAVPLLLVADMFLLEPRWIKTRRVRLRKEGPVTRLVHITDIHYEGQRGFLEKVVRKINALAPEFVCFTGDLVDQKEPLNEALEILSGLKAPVYGVPGNHDYWSKMSFEPIVRCLAGTGGAWLVNQQALTPDGKFAIFGLTAAAFRRDKVRVHPTARNICLIHFPAWVEHLEEFRFDLMLAGHSHGGQVRLPFLGAISRPYAVEQYDRGLFQTPSGALYVNPGLGGFPVKARFLCRPEITLIEL